MCEECDRERDRVYLPVRLRCKSPELAEALRVIITARGGAAKHDDGTESPPYVEGDVLVMPWMGHPRFVNGITNLAMQTGAAEPADVREMTFGAMAQGMETDVENVRELGETIASAMSRFMSTVGSSRAIDIGGIMDTLDTDVLRLMENEGPDGTHHEGA